MAFNAPKKGGSSLYQPLSDINVTPLVDVMLVLLIVFMITAPMLAAGVKVNLPQAKAAQPLKPKEPVVITVSKDGKSHVNADEVPLELLVATVKAKLAGEEEHVIHIRGDKEAAYGDVVAVMDLLASNGMTKLAILSDSRKQPAGKTPPTGPAPAGATLASAPSEAAGTTTGSMR